MTLTTYYKNKKTAPNMGIANSWAEVITMGI